ncbi:unnamed protein product [Mycena citricolor]|uniref:Zn(2)-C6 fungal-type domain-containing protein n=1 Tax=Mycena citricolor TaxID=2018698 RepID=A0AAD2HH95_9AGAR|nr:unnamed protein product [Mycena citricolor]
MMPEDSCSSAATTSPVAPRPKPPKTSSAGSVRGRTSPGPDSSDASRPTKRARKAINCEPCRNSKLKCDRNRPCSSCVLRGTATSCYQDGRGPEPGEYGPRGDDGAQRVDPAQEFARLRQSISLLEAYVFPSRPYANNRRPPESPGSVVLKKEPVDMDMSERATPTSVTPGMLGSREKGGLYTGVTATTSHLLLSNPDARSSEESDPDRPATFSRPSPPPPLTSSNEYDRDLLALLPSIEAIDGLIAYYFEFCNWIYRHVNQHVFLTHWERYKSGTSADRVILSTACVIMALATYYLPPQHRLLEHALEQAQSQGEPIPHEQLGLRYFDVSTTALQRRMSDDRSYSLELIELLLIRCHYMTTTKRDGEEIWHAKGEIVTIGTAMGLHRDPGRWRMHRDIAERRRWAWWHIVLLERWQAFMFGRPISISSHHFDTQLPSYCDPSLDKSGRLYLPNIALFRLAFILGDIMDDAVSVRPVPYNSILANDRALASWMETLPHELDLDEYRLARNLASLNLATRRLGVQSVVVRTSYFHIRFTLHRQFASAAAKPGTGLGHVSPEQCAQSLEIAVTAADQLITMTSQARPDFLAPGTSTSPGANASAGLAVPGHMNWGPFHCFSAAMFFSFQLIANPEQAGASFFRNSVRKAMSTLELHRGAGVAERGLDVLNSLAPLYDPDFRTLSGSDREREKARILGVVRRLAFPYHDKQERKVFGESPRAMAMGGPGHGHGMSSPANSTSVSPPLGLVSALPSTHYGDSGGLQNLSSVRNTGPSASASALYPQSAADMRSPPAVMSPNNLAHHPHHHPQHNSHGYTDQPRYQLPPPAQPPAYGSASDMSRYATGGYAQHGVDDETVWGAAMGFNHGEWTQFLDVLRPEQAPGR